MKASTRKSIPLVIRQHAVPLKRYVRNSIALYASGGRKPSVLRLLSLYPRWQADLNRIALEQQMPWLTYDAIRLLDSVLRGGEARVFEYGSGGSTFYFARRAAEVVSVEHDVGWSEDVCRALAVSDVHNVRHLHVPPDEVLSSEGCLSEGLSSVGADDTDPALCLSSDFPGRTLRDYVSSIDVFPDGYFDVVLVDGRARPSCLAHAMPKVAPGGWLLLDNAERPGYRRAQQALQGPEWDRRLVFPGPGPGVFEFFSTAAWRRTKIVEVR